MIQLGPNDPNVKLIIFGVTSNAKCFARRLSNPYAHGLAFISSIQVSWAVLFRSSNEHIPEYFFLIFLER